MSTTQVQGKVSVIMAAFNAADTLVEALDSIAAQSYENWELIVCDDASTDGTYRLLEDFKARFPGQVVLLRNERNAKLAYSLNRCLEHVTGQYVARMDADDRSTPNRFRLQVDFLEAHPDVDLVGTAMQRFDENGLHDVVLLPLAPNRFSLRYGVTFAHATVMARREVFRELDGYVDVERTVRCEDHDLWFRFFAAGFEGRNLAEPLYHVREDTAALKRRTWRVRWNTYRTVVAGFRLLDFPIHWYFRPTLALAKGLVPYRVIGAYRQWQARKVTDRLPTRPEVQR